MANNALTVANTGDVNTYVLTGLTHSTLYSIKVAGVNSFGTGAYSATQSATTLLLISIP